MKLNFKTMQFAVIISALCLCVTACTKPERDDNFPKGDAPPVPGGYTNSSQVATSNLLAYWGFDGDSKESKSSTAPTVSSNTSYVTGIKGQGLHFTNGYAVYPTIAALNGPNAIKSVSVSLWVNFANNGSQASEFFALSQPSTLQTDWLAILNVAAETSHPTSSSDLVLHSWIGTYTGTNRTGGGDNINDYGNLGTDFQSVAGKANTWVHYVMRYDAATEAIDLFANSIRVSNNNFRTRTGLGPILAPPTTQVLLGGFPTAATGFNLSGLQSWQALLTGSIDELRVYNKALSDLEISALFQLEKQGR